MEESAPETESVLEETLLAEDSHRRLTERRLDESMFVYEEEEDCYTNQQ
jgi:hypothetical protein